MPLPTTTCAGTTQPPLGQERRRAIGDREKGTTAVTAKSKPVTPKHLDVFVPDEDVGLCTCQ